MTTLGADELAIIEYLKSWKGTSVSLVDICRRAGGRQKFEENAHWANPLVSRLVDEKILSGNDRGHYCYNESPDNPMGNEAKPAPAPEPKSHIKPYNKTKLQSHKPGRWVSPEIASILKRAGKQVG